MALLICFALLALLGCSSCSKPKTASLSGSVVLTNDSGDPLLDPVDFSGVTIALYAPAALDTTLVRLNTKHPQIGVIISQESEFDHRGAEPLKLTSSAADGSFLLEGVDAGTYNLAFISPEWGVRYVCGLQLAEGENRELASVVMFPVTSYGSYQEDDIVFQAEHNYLIEETAFFVGNITIEPGALIYATAGSSLKMYGDLSTPVEGSNTEAWKILPAKNAFTAVPADIGVEDYWFALEIRGADSELKGGIIRHVSNSVAVFTDYIEVSDMIFRYANTGLSIQQGNATISNVIATDCLNTGINIQSDQVGTTEVTRCIIMNNYAGVSVTLLGEFDVNNNYLYNITRGVWPVSCTGVITHNEFELVYDDIFQHAGHADVFYNKFYHTRHWTIRPYHSLLVNYNDFYHTDAYFVVIRVNSYPPTYSYVFEDFDARNNYWAPANVEPYIWDAVDNPDYPGEECAHYVLYQPRRANPVPGAGIQ